MSKEPFYRRRVIPAWLVFMVIVIAALAVVGFQFKLEVGQMLGASVFTAFVLIITSGLGSPMEEEVPQPVSGPTISRDAEETALIAVARKAMDLLELTDHRKVHGRIRALLDKEKPPKPVKEKGGPKIGDLQRQIGELTRAGQEKDGTISRLESERDGAAGREKTAFADLEREREEWRVARELLDAEILRLGQEVARLGRELLTATEGRVNAEAPLLERLRDLQAAYDLLVLQSAQILQWGEFTDARIDSLTRDAADYRAVAERLGRELTEKERQRAAAEGLLEGVRLELAEANATIERQDLAREAAARSAAQEATRIEEHVAELGRQISALRQRAELAEANLDTMTKLKDAAAGRIAGLDADVKRVTGERDTAVREAADLKRSRATGGGGNSGKMRTIPTFTCKECPGHRVKIGDLERDLRLSRAEAEKLRTQVTVLGEGLIPLIPGVFAAMAQQYLETRPLSDICDTSPEPDAPPPTAHPTRRNFVGGEFPDGNPPSGNEP